MKLKKVAALCKTAKRAIIFQEWRKRADGTEVLWQQYISDGYAAYSANGPPPLRKDTLLRIFDVSEEDFEKWHVSVLDFPENLCFEDEMDEEMEIKRFFWPIVRNGDTLRCFGTEENGMLFVEEKRLDPVGDSGWFKFYERRTDQGQPYIAVKDGFLLQALILPKNVLSESAIEDFREFLFRVQKEMINRNLSEIRLEQDEIEKVEENSGSDIGEQMEIAP